MAKAASKQKGDENLPAESLTSLPAVDQEFADFENDRSGLENVTSADVVIPRMTIIQKLSPQLDKKGPLYIEGAEEGDFCNTATGEIFRGEIILIPCHFVRRILEWKPRRGGLAGIHDDIAILAQAKPDEKRKMILPNGNILSETAQYYCIHLVGGKTPRRIFVPLSSTQLKHSRKWMTLITGEKGTRQDGSEFNLPIYFRSWKAIPVDEANQDGSWKSWRFAPSLRITEIDPTKKLLEEARRYYKDASEGLVRGEVVEDDHEAPARDQSAPL